MADIKCSFCSKDSANVSKIIAGNDVYICDECVDVCSSVIHKTPDKEPSFDVYQQTVHCAVLQDFDDNIIEDMKAWIKENIDSSWIRVYKEPNSAKLTHKFVFESESDLVAFKLRWI